MHARGIIILHHDLLSPQFLEDQVLLPGTFYRLGAVPRTRDEIRGEPLLDGSQFRKNGNVN